MAQGAAILPKKKSWGYEKNPLHEPGPQVYCLTSGSFSESLTTWIVL